jgi:hypothetical protein
MAPQLNRRSSMGSRSTRAPVASAGLRPVRRTGHTTVHAAGIGNDGHVVYPGHPDIPDVPRGALDDEWLRVVASLRLVVITRDQRIRYRPVENLLWMEHRVRGFVLTGRASQSTADSLAILAQYWTSIEQVIDAGPDGPWMYAVTKSVLGAIEL